MSIKIRVLIQKLEALPPERIAEVEDFVDLSARTSPDTSWCSAWGGLRALR